MINFKKRFLSAVVAFAMIFTSFTFTAIAEETEIKNIYADSKSEAKRSKEDN